jgi:hypothetical protein
MCFVTAWAPSPADPSPSSTGIPRRREKVSVRRAADLRFAEIEIQLRRDRSALFQTRSIDGGRSLSSGGRLMPPVNEHLRPIIDRLP